MTTDLRRILAKTPIVDPKTGLPTREFLEAFERLIARVEETT